MLLALPPTELTGAGAEELFELHAARQSEISDSAATRRAVKVGLPALIYPPGMVYFFDRYDDNRSVWRLANAIFAHHTPKTR
ncbi:hypothetical protein ACNY9Y_001470 [Cronobacter dublinensis]